MKRSHSHRSPFPAGLVRSLSAAGALAAVLALPPAWAQTAEASAAPTTAASGTSAAAAQTWVAGEIRRVDAQGRLTIRHADIPHLGMEAMTMVFRVKPGVLAPDQLKALRPGDRVEFQAESPQGQLTVTALRPAAAASGATSAPATSAPATSAPAAHDHKH